MKKKITVLFVVLAAALLVLTAIHLMTHEQVPEGALAVHAGENTEYIVLESFDTQKVTGTIVNGKGQEKQVDTMGVPLIRVLEAAKVSADGIGTVTVTADDAFSAEIAAQELGEDKVFLTREEDGSLTLVVFGDSNSKRQVRNVVSVDVQ